MRIRIQGGKICVVDEIILNLNISFFVFFSTFRHFLGAFSVIFHLQDPDPGGFHQYNADPDPFFPHFFVIYFFSYIMSLLFPYFLAFLSTGYRGL